MANRIYFNLQVNKCLQRLKGPAGINHEKEKRILRKYRLYAEEFVRFWRLA